MRLDASCLDSRLAPKDIAREMHYKRKLAPSEIAKVLGRDKSTVTRLLFHSKPKPAMKVGKPKKLTTAQVRQSRRRCAPFLIEDGPVGRI